MLDRPQAEYVCGYITDGGDPDLFRARFRDAVSPGFDPDLHLARIGCANQTTMLSSESLAIGDMFRDAMRERFGDAELPQRFRAFDTICSATQDRQDAVMRLLDEHALDLMVVVGGYNSSNTCNLARICSARVPTFHIAAPEGLVSVDSIRHRDVGSKTEVTHTDWLPARRPACHRRHLRGLHAGQPGRTGHPDAGRLCQPGPSLSPPRGKRPGATRS